MSGYDAAGHAAELAAVIRERLAADEDRLAPIGDAVGELERLLALDGLHPDAALRAREAISCLAAVWLTDDERDERATRWMT